MTDASPIQRVTDHAEKRWRQRMPADARRPMWAAFHSTKTGLRSHPHWDDRTSAVRAYFGRSRNGTEYDAVLVEDRGTIVTTYRVGSIDDGALRAFFHALRQDVGVVDETQGGNDD